MKGTWDDHRDPIRALPDPALFEEFVRTETRTFLGFFRRLGAAPEEAEDLVQEVFLRLYHRASSYQPQERFGAYAFRTARNAWIDLQRRRASRPGHLSLDAASPDPGPAGRNGAFHERLATDDPTPAEGAARREDAGRLRAALACLPEHHRLVFELGVLQELSYAEIGAILDIPVGTVKSRMFHAVRKLREAVETENCT